MRYIVTAIITAIDRSHAEAIIEEVSARATDASDSGQLDRSCSQLNQYVVGHIDFIEGSLVEEK